ncbi:MAG: alkaline shock response membrane anchor protein AmaP [Fusobacteriaceae bacterium]|jgi:uncharacterized alkaline shock family protein YloU|nr:alkaline shock response membrane anchor protein AmaP [Fusobacteriaceae bacterium]
MIRKIIYFFAWVGIFLFSLLGIVYAISKNFVLFFFDKFTILTPFLTRLSIFIISSVYLLLCIFKIKFGSSKNNNYEIRTADGVVTVSPNIITNYVRDTFKDDDEIKNLKVETIRNDKKFDIKIKTDISTEGNVAQKSIDIQNKIKNDIANRIGINIGEVEVKISKLINKKSAEPTNKTSTNPDISTSKPDTSNFKVENNYEKINTIPTNLETSTVNDHQKEEPKEEPKKIKKSFFGLFKNKFKKNDENSDNNDENKDDNKDESNENSEYSNTESDDKNLY